MRRIFVLSALLLVGILLKAQNQEKEKSKTSEGYYNLTQLLFLIGEKQEVSAAMSDFEPSVTVVNGYRCSEHFALGIGLGVTTFEYAVYPVFADIRINIFKGNFSPVFAFKGGYSFAKNSKDFLKQNFYDAEYKNSGGWMLNPEIGFKTNINQHFDFLFTLGYYRQKLKSTITENRGQSLEHNIATRVNRVAFTIGFLFK